MLQSLLDQLPSQLKDDLLYCRRALHDFLNVHLMLAPCLNNSLEGNGAFKLVVFLETLENEMRAIEKEQFLLMEELKFSVTQFLMQQDLLFDTGAMDDNVTYLLNMHSDLSSSRVIAPQRVTVRCTVSELMENYRIFTDEVSPACDLTVLSSSNSSIEWLDNDANEKLAAVHEVSVFKDGYESVTKVENHHAKEINATTRTTKRRRKINDNQDNPIQQKPLVITVSSPETSPELLSDHLPTTSDHKLKQIEFLKNFNLVTHETTAMMKKRRSKRMRVQAERKDYTSARKKRVSTGAVEKAPINNGQKRPRGRPRSVGIKISA